MSTWSYTNRVRALAAALLLLAHPAIGVAELAKPSHETATAPALPTSSPSTTKVTGFRSAMFGTDEAAVRSAIEKDFGISGSAVTKSQNAGDRTDVLSVKVPDVLSGGGQAEVGYVFGYRSKKLIQVSVIWSKATDKAQTAERLYANGEALKSYFLNAGYVPGTVSTDAAMRDGVLLFRGADAEGHTVALMLRGTVSAGADKGASTLVPTALLLFYIADPKTPDVFKIPAGRF